MSKAIDQLDAWYHGPQGQRAFLGSLGVSESGRIGFEVGEVLQRLSQREVVQSRLRFHGYATGALEILAYIGEWGRGAISYELSLAVGEDEDAVDIEDSTSAKV